MQSSKKTVVAEKDGKLVIMTNPAEGDYCNLKHVVDPDLKKVRGLPPHQWKIENGEVLPAVPHTPLPLDPEPEAPKPAPAPQPEPAPTPVTESSPQPLPRFLVILALLLSASSLAISVWEILK